jgi:hypothetical protein
MKACGPGSLTLAAQPGTGTVLLAASAYSLEPVVAVRDAGERPGVPVALQAGGDA